MDSTHSKLEPYVKLSNRRLIPRIGFGTYKVKDCVKIVKKAIDIGYRLFDTAAAYNNEAEVGQAIREKIHDGTITREDVYLIDKIWCDMLRPELMESAVKESLLNLGLEYIDLYLIHWPTACKIKNRKEDCKKSVIDPNELVDDNDVALEDLWKTMEMLFQKGYVKSIGFSNFNSVQINRILKIAHVRPVVNEIECNPYCSQTKMIEFCKNLDITVIAYSPFWRKTSTCEVDMLSIHEQPVVKHLAEKYGKTTAQIVLRYLLQLGVIPIPKTTTETRSKENFDVFNFDITPDDILQITELNSNIRGCDNKERKFHKEYPFNIEY